MKPTTKIFLAILSVLCIAGITGLCYGEFLQYCKVNNFTLQLPLLIIGTAFIMFMSMVNVRVYGWIKNM